MFFFYLSVLEILEHQDFLLVHVDHRFQESQGGHPYQLGLEIREDLVHLFHPFLLSMYLKNGKTFNLFSSLISQLGFFFNTYLL